MSINQLTYPKRMGLGIRRHTKIKNLQKGLPQHLRGTKEYKKAVKELLQREFLNIKPLTGEYPVGLNSHKQKEIYEFLQEQ